MVLNITAILQRLTGEWSALLQPEAILAVCREVGYTGWRDRVLTPVTTVQLFLTVVSSAAVLGLLVFPFTAFIQTMARGTDPVAALVSWWPPPWWSEWHTAVFLILFWLPMSVSLLFRRRALDLYDELPPPTPAGTPTAQETHELIPHGS
jgi:hypothetical protein